MSRLAHVDDTSMAVSNIRTNLQNDTGVLLADAYMAMEVLLESTKRALLATTPGTPVYDQGEQFLGFVLATMNRIADASNNAKDVWSDLGELETALFAREIAEQDIAAEIVSDAALADIDDAGTNFRETYLPNYHYESE